MPIYDVYGFAREPGFKPNPELKRAFDEEEQRQNLYQQQQDLKLQEKENYSLYDNIKDSFTVFNRPVNMWNVTSDIVFSELSDSPMNINSSKAIEWGKQYNLYDKKTWSQDFSAAKSERELVALLENKKKVNEAAMRREEYSGGVTNFFTGAVAGLVDPTILLPGGQAVRAAKTIEALGAFYKTKNAISIGGMSALYGTEYTLSMQQLQASKNDSELLDAALYGGVLGMGVGALLGAKVARQTKKNQKIKEVLDNTTDLESRKLLNAEFTENLRKTGVYGAKVIDEGSAIKLKDGTILDNPLTRDIATIQQKEAFSFTLPKKAMASFAPITTALSSTSDYIKNIALKLKPSTFALKGKANIEAINNFTNKEIDDLYFQIGQLEKQQTELTKTLTDTHNKAQKATSALNKVFTILQGLRQESNVIQTVTAKLSQKYKVDLTTALSNLDNKYKGLEDALLNRKKPLTMEELNIKIQELAAKKETETTKIKETLATKEEKEIAAINKKHTDKLNKVQAKYDAIKDKIRNEYDSKIKFNHDTNQFDLLSTAHPDSDLATKLSDTIDNYKQTIGKIRAEELDRRTRTVGDYIIQGETVYERKGILESIADDTSRELLSDYNKLNTEMSFKEWTDKLTDDMNIYYDNLKEQVYRAYYSLLDENGNFKDLASIKQLYKDITGIDIALSKTIPDDLKSVVLRKIAQEIESQTDITNAFTPSMQKVRNYFKDMGEYAKKAGTQGFNNIIPEWYLHRQWNIGSIRDGDRNNFIASVIEGITNSVEMRLAKESLVESLKAKGYSEAGALAQAEQTLLEKANTMAETLYSNIISGEALQDLDAKNIISIGKVKLRTIPLDETKVSEYLNNNMMDKIHSYSYKYSGMIALSEKLGISSTKELTDMLAKGIPNNIRDKQAVKEINAITAMIEDILGVRGLNPYNAQGMINFVNEIKKFNFDAYMGKAGLNATILEAANVYRIIGNSMFNTDAFKLASKAVLSYYISKFPKFTKYTGIASLAKMSDDEEHFLNTLLMSGDFMSMDMRAMNNYLAGAVNTTHNRFSTATSAVTDALSHFYGMKPGTYFMQVFSRSAYINSLLKIGSKLDNLSEIDIKRIAKLGITPDDIRQFAKIANPNNEMSSLNKQFGLVPRFNADNFVNDKELLNRILDSSLRAGQEMVLHYDAAVLPSFVTKYDKDLVSLMWQFLKFPMVAHEKLLLAGLDEFDAKTAGSMLMSLTIGYMYTKMREDLLIESGQKEESKRRYTDDAEGQYKLSLDLLNYVGYSGISTLLFDKIAHAATMIKRGQYDTALVDTVFGVSGSTYKDTMRTAKNSAQALINYMNGEDYTEQTDRAMKSFERIMPFHNWFVTELVNDAIHATNSQQDWTDYIESKYAGETPITMDDIEKDGGTTDNKTFETMQNGFNFGLDFNKPEDIAGVALATAGALLLRRPVAKFMAKSNPTLYNKMTGANQELPMMAHSNPELLAKIRANAPYDPTKPAMFVGQKAKLQPDTIQRLSVAKSLEGQKTPNESIWKQTGWFKAPDGEWRFEIPLDEEKIKTYSELTAPRTVEGTKEVKTEINNRYTVLKNNLNVLKDPKIQTLYNKYLPYIKQTEKELGYKLGAFKNYDELDNFLTRLEHNVGDKKRYNKGFGTLYNFINWNMKVGNSTETYKTVLEPITYQEYFTQFPLKEVIDPNHSLFKAYPSLEDIFVELSYLGNDTYGIWKRRYSTIELNISKPDSFKSTLQHELQHAIQDIEGFAQGGSPEIFTQEKFDKYFGKVENVSKDGLPDTLIRIAKNPKKFKETVTNLQTLIDDAEEQAVREITKQHPNAPINELSEKIIDRQYELLMKTDYPKLLDDLNNKYGSLFSNYEAYRRLYGETESRLTQNRADSGNFKEFPLNMLDIPIEQSIILKGNK